MSKFTESLKMNFLSVKFSCMGGTITSIIQKLNALSRNQRVCSVILDLPTFYVLFFQAPSPALTGQKRSALAAGTDRC